MGNKNHRHEQSPHEAESEHGADHDHGGCGDDHEHGHEHGHKHAPQTAAEVAAAEAGKEFERRFLFQLEAVAVAFWGVVLLYFFLSTRVVNYLTTAGTFREQALIAGLGLLVLAIFNLMTSAKKDVDCADCGHDHDHEHEHEHDQEGGWVSRVGILFLLIAPALAASLFTPDRFSDSYVSGMAQSALNAGAGGASNEASSLSSQAKETKAPDGYGEFTLATLEQLKPRNKNGDFPLEVVELVATAQDTVVRKILDGQPVECTGQLVKDNFSGKPGRLRLFVLQVTCCAADARPVSLSLDFSGNGRGGVPEHAENGWYKIRGVVAYETIRGQASIYLKVADMQSASRPADASRLY